MSTVRARHFQLLWLYYKIRLERIFLIVIYLLIPPIFNTLRVENMVTWECHAIGIACRNILQTNWTLRHGRYLHVVVSVAGDALCSKLFDTIYISTKEATLWPRGRNSQKNETVARAQYPPHQISFECADEWPHYTTGNSSTIQWKLFSLFLSSCSFFFLPFLLSRKNLEFEG